MVKYLDDGDDSGTCLGQATTDLISFHGKTPVDQYGGITLATNASAGTVRTAVRTILTMLTEKGLIASGP